MDNTTRNIDGRTGLPLGAAICDPILADAVTMHERALNLYFRLVDRAPPAILELFGKRTALRPSSQPDCRKEE